LLFPFRLVVRPFLAANAAQFLLALGPALVVLLLHYFWVIRSNVAFEEASVEVSKRFAEKVAAMRSGQTQLRPNKAKRAPFQLAPLGPPAIALLWKNLIGAGQFFTLRVWFLLLIAMVPMLVVISTTAPGRGLSTFVAVGAMMVVIWSVLIGPQVLRHDFRQDLVVADILKTYPIRGWQLVLGELLAPAAILSGVQWLLILIGALCVGQLPGGESVSWGWRLAIAFAGLLVFPALNLICLIIPNGSVLLFPAWFQIGRDGPQGIEATGQRLILMIGQLLVLTLALLPGGLLFGAVYFVFAYFGQQIAGVPLAAIAATAVMLAEVGLAIFFLGKVFERFDLSSEA